MRSYREKVDLAVRLAGNGSGWDERFLTLLDILGLCLVLGPNEKDRRYPSGFAFTAPRPFDNPKAWPVDSLIKYTEETT